MALKRWVDSSPPETKEWDGEKKGVQRRWEATAQEGVERLFLSFEALVFLLRSERPSAEESPGGVCFISPAEQRILRAGGLMPLMFLSLHELSTTFCKICCMFFPLFFKKKAPKIKTWPGNWGF